MHVTQLGARGGPLRKGQVTKLANTMHSHLHMKRQGRASSQEGAAEAGSTRATSVPPPKNSSEQYTLKGTKSSLEMGGGKKEMRHL